jgi:uncharacterized protein (DUF2132 family)
MGQIYLLDNALAELKAKQDNHIAMSKEYTVKADLARQDVHALELKIADREGQLKAANAERGMTLGLVKSYVYQASAREKHAEFAASQCRKREKQLFMKETQKRMRQVRKEFE